VSHTYTGTRLQKNQVSAAQTCCVGHNLLISSEIAPPYYTHTELSFVKQYCVILGLSRFTNKIASPQPCISSLTGFTHAGSVRTDNLKMFFKLQFLPYVRYRNRSRKQSVFDHVTCIVQQTAIIPLAPKRYVLLTV
jgi:hypothetical protein